MIDFQKRIYDSIWQKYFFFIQSGQQPPISIIWSLYKSFNGSAKKVKRFLFSVNEKLHQINLNAI